MGTRQQLPSGGPTVRHGGEPNAAYSLINQRVGWALRVKDSELRSDQHVYSKQIKPQYEENHP
jgi:hypothetical protein